MEKILVLCAHPDDETLGMGGTIAFHTSRGDKVFVLIFADGESARENYSTKKINRRQEEAKKAASNLSVTEIQFLQFRDQILDTVSILELAKKIEMAIKKWNPDTIYTHYWGDVNQDHRRVFESSLIAARPTPNSKIKKIVCYETPSSTEWGSIGFKPNLFVDITKFMRVKLRAFKNYTAESNSFPHPRSEEAIIARAKYWGSTIGCKYAEPFIIIRDIVM
jgi:LmbE family N-acetylglucosaminyl deacetylase